MNRQIWFVGISIISALLFMSGETFSVFSHTTKSTNNTFTAASVFPTSIISLSPSPQNIANHIVISEVQIAGGSADDEFVEIYNPTSLSINLSTLPLKLHLINSSGVDSNKTLTFINNSIPAHGFFLIGPASGFVGPVSLNATYATSGTKLVPNGAVYISTSSSTDKTGVIDLLGFGSAALVNRELTAVVNPIASTSVERKANVFATQDTMKVNGEDELKGNGYDTENNSIDFVVRTLSQPQNNTSLLEAP